MESEGYDDSEGVDEEDFHNLIFIFFLKGECFQKAYARSQTIPDIEKEALIALYNSTDGDNWTNNSGWLTDPDPCNWYGVFCSDGHIVTIDLDENNLVGPIPSEIGDLSVVSFLYFGDNAITSLPAGIGNLRNIGQLSFRNNRLTEIPPEIGNIPFTYSGEDELDFTNNDLSSLPAEFYNLSELEHLYLSGNQLSSLHHDIGKMGSLSVLKLGSNHLTNLPEEIGDLSNLYYFDISDNDLSYLPSEIGMLSDLGVLYLEKNKLSDLPPDIGNLSNLRHLDLSNNQLSIFPPEIYALSNLWELDLSHNRLSGRISSDIDNLSQLYYLDLSRNALSKEVPGTITNITGFFNCPYPGKACQYFSPFADFGFNMLFSSDKVVQNFLDTIDPDWAETQTLYPSQISVKDVHLDSVELSWVPILYTGDGGYYEIGYATSPDEPYSIHGTGRVVKQHRDM